MFAKIIKWFKTGLIAGLVLLLNSVTAFADVTTHTAADVATKAQNIITPIITAFGGILILASVAMIGGKMILAHNNPDKRATLMDGIAGVALGSFILGAALLIAGFFWGLGQ